MKHAFLFLLCWTSFAALATARDVPSTTQTAAAMTDAAQKFLKTLDSTATQKATMAFDDPSGWTGTISPSRSVKACNTRT